jgi:hypothetical protein
MFHEIYTVGKNEGKELSSVWVCVWHFEKRFFFLSTNVEEMMEQAMWISTEYSRQRQQQ